MSNSNISAEKKDDNNLDNFYEDSIFSVTEDVQYPLFDAKEAMSGIFNKNSTKNKNDSTPPRLNMAKKQSEKSRFNTSSSMQEEKSHTFKFGNAFESDIKLDEPLTFRRDISKDQESKTSTPQLFNRPPTLGLSSIPMATQGARRMGAHRGPFRPQAKKNVNLTPGKKQEELSPRSKMMPSLAKKVSNLTQEIKIGEYAKTVPIVTKSSSINTEEEKPESVNKPEICESVESKNQTISRANPPKKINMEVEAEQKPIQPKQPVAKQEQGLSGRKDVVYKTLLRSVKRYYSTEFETRTEYATLTKSKQEKRCLKIIDRFTRNIFADYLTSEQNAEGETKEKIKGIDFDLISAFVLALIIPSYVKRNMKHTETFKTYDTFYEWLYRYSHKRLEAALAIPAVAWVFKIFLDGSTFENLLLNDSTLSKDQEAYLAAKNEFIDIIDKVQVSSGSS